MNNTGLPAALVDNAIVSIAHPGQSKELIERLEPRLKSLPEIWLNHLGNRLEGSHTDHVEEPNQSTLDHENSSQTKNLDNALDSDHFNPFLDTSDVNTSAPVGLEKLFLVLCDEGWSAALDMLKDRYVSSTWSGFALDLLVRLTRCVQCVAGWIQWWSSGRAQHNQSRQLRQLHRRKHWSKLSIKFLRWHPTLIWADQYVLALVSKEDVVYVYFSGRNDPTVVNGLRNSRVYCMDWKPFSLSMVLGCRDGVHTVTVSARSRFPTTHQILTRPDVSFVTDLSISPQSLHMATASILSPSVHIWDLADLRVSHLIKLFSAPNYSVRWSPSGLHLAVATTGVSFKFYNLLDSSCNKWTLPRSYITSLVWSPDSRYVLFSTAEDPYVHFIQFESVTGIEDKRATPLLDTRSFLEDFDRGDNNFKPNNCNRTAPVDRNGTFNRRDCSNGNGFSNDDSFGSNDSTRSSTSRDQGSKNTNGCANRNDTYRTGCINKSDSLNRTDSFDSNDRNARTGNDDGSSMNDCRNDECNNTACMSNRSDSYSTDNCTDYDCNNEHDCRNIDSTTTSTNEDNCTNLTTKYSFSSIHYNSRTNCSNETNDFKRNYTRIIDFDRSNSCIQRNGSSAETDSNTIDGSFSAIDHKRPSCIGTKYDGSRTNCTNRNEEFTGSDQNCNSRVVDLGKSENCRNRYGRAARIDNDGLNKPYSVKGTFPTGTTAKRRFDPIHSLALDQSGRYLAVSFRHAPVIGLYRLDIGVNIEIRSRHRLHIWPAFGRLDSMDFMPGENGKSPDLTVLTLAWNNGVVQHFPIL